MNTHNDNLYDKVCDELEKLQGDYAKLYGVVREYIACEQHPQIRGEAYRDLRGTYDLLSGADADQGWPACYQRSQESLFKAQRELEEALADNARLRGLLREACIGYESNYDDASSDKRLRRVPIFHAWYERAQAALEGKP